MIPSYKGHTLVDTDSKNSIGRERLIIGMKLGK